MDRENNMRVHFSSSTGDWETPQDLFDCLDSEFVFDLDVCATEENAKCANYFSVRDDGLGQDWSGHRCWMNPPYGRGIGKWIQKAYEAGTTGGCVVCLVPARVDTKWWWNYARKGEVRFIQGRLKFGNAISSAPFPSAVVIFRGGSPSVEWWDAYKRSMNTLAVSNTVKSG